MELGGWVRTAQPSSYYYSAATNRATVCRPGRVATATTEPTASPLCCYCTRCTRCAGFGPGLRHRARHVGGRTGLGLTRKAGARPRAAP
eukprot:778588-Rhodomonas_salina.1